MPCSSAVRYRKLSFSIRLRLPRTLITTTGHNSSEDIEVPEHFGGRSGTAVPKKRLVLKLVTGTCSDFIVGYAAQEVWAVEQYKTDSSKLFFTAIPKTTANGDVKEAGDCRRQCVRCLHRQRRTTLRPVSKHPARIAHVTTHTSTGRLYALRDAKAVRFGHASLCALLWSI
jgi:hypothetical protein